MAAAVRIGVWGAAGRMGQALVAAVAAEPGAELGAAFERPDHPQLGQAIAGQPDVTLEAASASSELNGRIDALIAFPLPAGLPPALAAARQGKVALVIGTTGYDAEAEEALSAAAADIPLLIEPNMSLGVNVLNRLLRTAAAALPGWDVEIHETHHAGKKDAPSGTAKLMVETVRAARGDKGQVVASRAGDDCSRGQDEIGVASSRAGDIAGTHTAYFAAPGECLELTHRAFSRANFANGALWAAIKLAGAKPGRYHLAELLED